VDRRQPRSVNNFRRSVQSQRPEIGEPLAVENWDTSMSSNHGVDLESTDNLLESRVATFFSHRFLPHQHEIEMSSVEGGAWRGYFSRWGSGELTSGKPDLKVRNLFYFGAELETDHALVRAGTPLHGPNFIIPVATTRHFGPT
jgi:isopenicillin N synthase-like dioxygenase